MLKEQFCYEFSVLSKTPLFTEQNLHIAKQCRRAGGGGKEGLYRRHPTKQPPKQ